jgi:DNA-binding transcriptional LysR family regulator
MQLQQLTSFVAVAEELHFRRAADRLNLSQPQLSVHIKALEDETGCLLFRRTSRRVALTEAGETLLLRARQILTAIGDARDELRAVSSGRIGALRIGFTISTSFHAFFSDSVKTYRSRFPDVTVSLTEMVSGRQIAALRANQIDIGFFRQVDGDSAGLVLTELKRDTLVVAMHRDNRLAAHPCVDLAWLSAEPFISYPTQSDVGIYHLVIALCQAAGFRPHVVQEVLEPSLMLGFVASGLGVAIVPASLQSIRMEHVVFRPIRDAGATTMLYLGHLSAETNARVDAFKSIVLAACNVDNLASPQHGLAALRR